MLFDQVTRLAFGLGDRGAAASVELPEAPSAVSRKPKVGLALGGGAARGWSHIGVIRALWESGVEIDVVAGTSIGAVVGGSAKAGKLDQLEAFARSLTKRRVIGLMDLHIGGSGLIAGDRLRRLLEQDLADMTIEDLPGHFGAIATELGTGHEIWLTRGRLVDAIRASYALPGIFDPVKIGGRWLMDGALVNPIPVTAARALGAELVIAVNLNGDIFGRGTVIQNHGTMDHIGEDGFDPTATIERGMFDSVRSAASMINPFARRSLDAPRLASVMIDAFNITQDRISRARLAGDPPDVMVAPKLARMGLFEFHRADEAIALGYDAAMRAMPDIVEALSAMVVAPR